MSGQLRSGHDRGLAYPFGADVNAAYTTALMRALRSAFQALWRNAVKASQLWMTILVGGVAALALAACYNGPDRTKAHVRLVNASNGYENLDLRLQELLTLSTAGYGTATEYSEADASATAATLASAGAATTLSQFTTSLSRDKYFSVVAYGNAGALRQVVLDDNLAAPAEGKTQLRVLHAAPDAGAVDVYVTATVDTLANSTAVLTGATFGGALAAPLTLNSGTWRVRITAAGSRTDVRLDLPAVVLPNRQVVTLVLTPSRGGTLVNALLLAQQAALSRHDTTQVRARAVAGVPAVGDITVNLSGFPLLSGSSNLPVSSGAYSLLEAGTAAPTITVASATVGAPATNLLAGGDYTLLVYGAAASPSSAWLVDDNRLPADGQARLRLVNGVAALPGTAALTLNSAVAATGVATGSASAYTEVSTRASADINVVSSGSPPVLFSSTARTLAAGASYSVFVLGTAGVVAGAVVADRER